MPENPSGFSRNDEIAQDSSESSTVGEKGISFFAINSSGRIENARTESRPLRGAENRNQADSSARADLELEAETARHSPPLFAEKT